MDPYLLAMTRRSTRDTGRRPYADPVVRPEPNLRRLVELVLHLANAEHHAATRPRATDVDAGTSTPTENDPAR